MRFLVIGENIDSGYVVPPEQVLQTVEQAVVPSFQQLAALEDQGKVKGGAFPGERAGAFVVDVDSYEELDRLMNLLPFFGLVKWQVKPLMAFSSIARQIPEYLHEIRSHMPPSGGTGSA